MDLYDAMKRHEVQVLRKAGLTLDAIAKQAGVSRRCVTDILNEPAWKRDLYSERRPQGTSRIDMHPGRLRHAA